MQTILEIELAAPLDDMREQVTEESRVVVEKCGEVERLLGRDQLVEPDLVWRQLGPVSHLQTVVRVGPRVAHALEDHQPSLG